MPILNPFKNIIFRSVFIVFISSIIYSQNVIVKGVVRNPADKPVKKANVTLRNLKDEIMFEDFTVGNWFAQFSRLLTIRL